MFTATSEKRVKALESQVARLQEELRAVRNAKPKDWRRTIGAFTDDDGMMGLLAEALRLRNSDRKKTRPKAVPKRRAGQ